MEFGGACGTSDFANVGRMKAATGEYKYAASGLFDEASDDRRALDRIRCAAGSEDAPGPSLDDGLQGFGRIWSLIECTMEGHQEWSSEVDKLASPG